MTINLHANLAQRFSIIRQELECAATGYDGYDFQGFNFQTLFRYSLF